MQRLNYQVLNELSKTKGLLDCLFQTLHSDFAKAVGIKVSASHSLFIKDGVKSPHGFPYPRYLKLDLEALSLNTQNTNDNGLVCWDYNHIDHNTVILLDREPFTVPLKHYTFTTSNQSYSSTHLEFTVLIDDRSRMTDISNMARVAQHIDGNFFYSLTKAFGFGTVSNYFIRHDFNKNITKFLKQLKYIRYCAERYIVEPTEINLLVLNSSCKWGYDSKVFDNFDPNKVGSDIAPGMSFENMHDHFVGIIRKKLVL